MTQEQKTIKNDKKFSRAFWLANSVELLERLAYYAIFIVITLYLSNVWGFSDIEAGIISGFFSAFLYLLPIFTGAYSDKIGFRPALILAFLLLTIGYLGLAVLPTFLESAKLVEYGESTIFTGLNESYLRWSIIPILILIVIGGSFIKSIISGTIAKETTTENRAKGYSIFYMMVNIGAFTGKSVVDPLRQSMGNQGLIYLNYFSAAMTLIALLAVFIFYKSTKTKSSENQSFGELWKSLLAVLTNVRLLVLILIVSGFWLIQSQMYATMPKYVIRLIGDSATPGWFANVNPLFVFLLVNFITSLMKKRAALTSIFVGMLIIPFSALVMSFGNVIDADSIFGLHPVALMMIVGIAMQAIAECFISPRYLEYFSLQAPEGQEGLYLGFSHLHSFFSFLLAFIMSGFLLDRYCPPRGNMSADAYALATEHAHYIWYVFVAIGLVSAIALFIYGIVTKKLDDKKLNLK